MCVWSSKKNHDYLLFKKYKVFLHSTSSTGIDSNHIIFETHTKARGESDLKLIFLANSIKNDDKT